MIITRIQQFKVMRFCSDVTVADTADFPVLRHVSDTKDTEYHRKFYFGKGILNQIKMLLTKFYFVLFKL